MIAISFFILSSVVESLSATAGSDGPWFVRATRLALRRVYLSVRVSRLTDFIAWREDIDQRKQERVTRTYDWEPSPDVVHSEPSLYSEAEKDLAMVAVTNPRIASVVVEHRWVAVDVGNELIVDKDVRGRVVPEGVGGGSEH